jgi:IS5 family transposase
MKPGKHCSLTNTLLEQLLEKVEDGKATRHTKVGQTFQVVKKLFSNRKTRYRGPARNTAQMVRLFGMANLILVNKRLIAVNA